MPAGDGVFVFANKNLLAGQYLPGTRWSNDQFTTPTPGSEPPAAVKPSAYKRATRAIDKCVLKIDSADGKFNIQSEYKGVPNFRRVASSTATDNDNELDPEQDPDDDDQDDEIESDAPRVYGCGQPSLDGLRKLLEGLQEEGVDKVMWINVRDEPVVYIKDASFSPRDERALNRALNFPELNSEKLNELEERLNERIRKDATLQGNLINYVQEEAAGPASADKLPDVRSNNNVTVEVKEKEEIKSVPQVFTMLEEDEDFSVSFNRVPLFDDKSPSVSMFDEVFNVLKEADSSTGIVFNCQMGKGRTTLGMIMASLYFQAQNPSSAQDEVMDDHMDDEELDEDEDGEYTHKKASPAAQDAQNDEPNLKMGEYDLINSLVNVLSDGTLSKKDVDQVINQCGQVQNVREAILFARDQHIKSTTTDRQQFWKAKGASFVERYFYLICFYAFLKEAIANDLDEAFTFAVWMEEHTEVTELISGTTLAHFNWM